MWQSLQGYSFIVLQSLALYPVLAGAFVTQPSTTRLGNMAQDRSVCDRSSKPTPVHLRRKSRCNNNSKLFGIHEWRDMNFDHLPQADDYVVVFDDEEDDDDEEEVDDEVYVSYLSVGSGTVAELGEDEKLLLDALSDEEDDNDNEESEEVMLLREVCVLPFPYEDALVQGETKQLRLYEERCVLLTGEVFISSRAIDYSVWSYFFSAIDLTFIGFLDDTRADSLNYLKRRNKITMELWPWVYLPRTV
jgi:hypothetical protein